MELPQIQFDVLTQLKAGSPAVIPDLAAALKQDQSLVSAACVALQEAGYVAVEETNFEELRLGPEAEAYLEKPLPEKK